MNFNRDINFYYFSVILLSSTTFLIQLNSNKKKRGLQSVESMSTGCRLENTIEQWQFELKFIANQLKSNWFQLNEFLFLRVTNISIDWLTEAFNVNPLAILLFSPLLWWRILIGCVLPVNTRKIPTKPRKRRKITQFIELNNTFVILEKSCFSISLKFSVGLHLFRLIHLFSQHRFPITISMQSSK